MIKKIFSYSFLFLFYFGTLQAQTNEPDSSKVSVGLGIELKSYFYDETLTPTASIILNLDLGNHIRLEPLFGFSTSESFDDYNNTESIRKGFTTGLGFYYLFYVNNVNPYLGVAYSISKSKSDYTDTDRTYDFERAVHNFGPVIGVEYRIVKRMSIGAEIKLIRINSSTTQVVSSGIEESGMKGFRSASSLKFRFFFM